MGLARPGFFFRRRSARDLVLLKGQCFAFHAHYGIYSSADWAGCAGGVPGGGGDARGDAAAGVEQGEIQSKPSFCGRALLGFVLCGKGKPGYASGYGGAESGYSD